MSNGGYKGSTPARETSPEQYPGVWELTEQFQAQADGNWPFQPADCAPKSLRFDGSSAYLDKTFGTKTTTFTLSFWVKRSKLGTWQYPWSQYDGSGYSGIGFSDDNRISLYNGGHSYTTAYFRDASAWYHLCLKVSSGSGTLYVNNQEVANQTGLFLGGGLSKIGNFYSGSHPFDGYIAEFNAVADQALDPDAFTFIDGQGILQPKRFTGDYSSGPVYSNFGSSSATLENGNWGQVFDGSKYMYGGSGASNGPALGNGSLSFSPIGLSGRVVKAGVRGGSNKTYTVNGTAMAFGSSSAEVAYIDLGSVQPITSIVGTSTNSSIWAQFYYIEVDGVVLTDASVGRNSFHLDFADSSTDAALGYDSSGVGNNWTPNNFNATSVASVSTSAVTNVANSGSAVSWSINISNHSSGVWYSTGAGPFTISWSGATANVDYLRVVCSHMGCDSMSINGSVASGPHVFSKTGAAADGYGALMVVTASTGTATVTLTNKTGQSNFIISAGQTNYNSTYASGAYDNVVPVPPAHKILTTTNNNNYGSLNVGDVDIAGNSIYAINSSTPSISVIGGSWSNGSIFTTVNQITDCVVDSPVNGTQTDPSGLGGIIQSNYATLNPLNSSSTTTLSDGNLAISSGSNWGSCMSTIAFTGGKYYYETTVTTSYSYIGAALATHDPNDYPSKGESWALLNDGNCYYDQLGAVIQVNTGTNVPVNAVVGTAIDADNGKIWWSVNGTWIGSGSPNPATGADPIFTNIPTDKALVACLDTYLSSATVNFGQQPFIYPLAGYKSLCTSNLPEPSIPVPSQYFDTKLYTSNASDLAVTGLQFSPDFVWVKNRELGNPHGLFDIVRGPNKYISSGRTNSEVDVSGSGYPGGTFNSFDSNGFTLGADSGNQVANYPANDAHVAWAWSAGDATTTIAAGSLNSSAYNFADWESMVTGAYASGWGTTYQTANAFDGNLATMVIPDGSQGWTFTPSTPIAGSTIEIYGWNDGCPNNGLVINGNNYGDALGADQTVGQWYTLPYSTLTSIQLTGDGSAGNTEFRLIAIRIDGKMLIQTGTSVTNVPSIASTVRSSPESGFSIVTWTAAANATVAHQLNKSPQLVITKSRQYGTAWRIWSSFFSSPDNRYLGFDTNGEGTYNGYWGSMTSNVITMPSVLDNNYGDMVAYCFTSIEGYSSFGSFQNPSSTEGAFLFLGFEPELLMIKCIINISSSSSSGDWIIKDATRSPFNNPSDGNTLVANVANAEDGYYGAGQAAIDILSNGFKIRHPNSSPAGDTGRLYIYAAWAKSPFKNARAR